MEQSRGEYCDNDVTLAEFASMGFIQKWVNDDSQFSLSFFSPFFPTLKKKVFH